MSPTSKKNPTRVRDVMTTEVVTVSPDQSLRDVIGLLDHRHIGGAPVVSGRQVLGVITASDVLAWEAVTPGVPAEQAAQLDWELESPPEVVEGEEAPGAYFSDWWADAGGDVAERFQVTRAPEWDLLGEHTVSEAMTTSLCTIGPDVELAEAARHMLQAGVHRLLVTENSTLLGIVTTSDIVRAVAERRL